MNKKRRRKHKKNHFSILISTSILLFIVSLINMFTFIFRDEESKQVGSDAYLNCQTLEKKLQNDQKLKIEIQDKGMLTSVSSLIGVVNKNKFEKYSFMSKEERKLNYKTNDSVQVCVYNENNHLVQNNELNSSERYSIFVLSSNRSKENYNINFNPEVINQKTVSNINEALDKDQQVENVKPPNNRSQRNDELSINRSRSVSKRTIQYNVQTYPNFKDSSQLKNIVNNIINIFRSNNFPTDNISITLIDVNERVMAQYQGHVPRYPASVSKLFWLVILYSYMEKSVINLDFKLSNNINKMMDKSDNEAASHIIDKITRTQSGQLISQEQFNHWYQKRKQLNNFFQSAGYSQLNITQKTFPIPYLDEYGKRPQGKDLKMRHLGKHDANNPIRNKLTTWHASRLMYEIVTNQAISPQYSQRIQDHLERNLSPQAWKIIDPRFEFNPVRAFFGENLPTNIRFLSKAGWTSSTRQEVAYIETPDQQTKYILAIFAEDKAYAKNWDIFPQLSKYVFQEMTKQSK